LRYDRERRLEGMKVAFATTDGMKVDEHFGRAGMFAVYEVKEKGFCFVEIRRFAEGRDTQIEETRGAGRLHEDLVQKKVDSLEDCKIIYLTEIGGPSASRLVKKGIMPVKVKEPVTIEESLERLSETIRKSPPPWLRKAITSEK
jgi:nitrogen fixation protein NifX